MIPQMGIAETLLKKGAPCPNDGILFNMEEADKLRVGIIERDGYKSLNNSLEKSLDICQHNYGIEKEKVLVLDKRNDELATSNIKSREFSTIERILTFVAGMAVMYGAYQISR